MRIALFSLTIFLLITSCNQKQSAPSVPKAVSDLATENLKGNVAQVETDSYIIDSTGKTGPLDEKDIEKFDSSGYSVSGVTMNGKDSIKSQTTLQRNENGFVTNVQTTGANNEKKTSLTIEYDSTGKYGIAKSYDSTGKMDSYYSDITSNNFGQVTGAKRYHPDSTLKMSFANDFDSIYFVGDVSKDSVGKVTYTSKVALNDKKDEAKVDETIVSTDPKTKKESTKNTITTYTYDGWDDHGNWTQQTTINDKGKPTRLVKRIITYR
jgi:hypothetical protein